MVCSNHPEDWTIICLIYFHLSPFQCCFFISFQAGQKRGHSLFFSRSIRQPVKPGKPGPPSLDQLGTIDVSSHHPWRRPRLGAYGESSWFGPPQLWLKLQLWREKPLGHGDLNGYFYGVIVPLLWGYVTDLRLVKGFNCSKSSKLHSNYIIITFEVYTPLIDQGILGLESLARNCGNEQQTCREETLTSNDQSLIESDRIWLCIRRQPIKTSKIHVVKYTCIYIYIQSLENNTIE